MPPRITSPYAKTFVSDPSVKNKNFPEYRPLYPNGKNLKPGSELHDRLVDLILTYARESERQMVRKHPKWRAIDHKMTAYITLTEYEEYIKSKDENKPVSVVVPEMYSNRETLLTYMMAVFGEAPFLRYAGWGPEDILGAILLEKTVEFQTKKTKMMLACNSMFSDSFTYGIGVATTDWRVDVGKRPVVENLSYYDPLSDQLVVTGMERKLVDAVLFEGTEVVPIDPYRYLPDPSPGLANPQRGLFVGWLTDYSYYELLNDEASQGSMFFNVKYLEEQTGQSSIYMHDVDGRDQYAQRSDGLANPILRRIGVIHMYIRLIPSEFGLGPGTSPEVWGFSLAGDTTIIAAHKVEVTYNNFPLVVCAPDAQGHELLPMSKMELVYPLQGVMDFEFNSRVAAIRQTLKGRFVADPKVINIPRLMDPDINVITTRRPVWGRGVKDAVEQLKVDDVTAGNIGDMLTTREIMRTVTGAVDSLQGIQRTSGERVTAQEFRSTKGSALSRLQHMARIISMQCMHDLAMIYALNTQRFMTEDVYIKTAGRWEQVLMQEYGITDQRLRVTPFDLDVMFDVDVSDGSVEGGEFADQWVQMLGIIAGSPELMMTFDMTRVALHLARISGAKNAHEFLRKMPLMQTNVQPQEQIDQEQQAGNIVPIQELSNATARG